MAQADHPREHLTDYERAICYYTLPRVVHPITYGLITAYAVCLFEAAGALIVGLVTGNETWTTAGAIGLFAIVLFGIAAFMARALRNELRQKRALAAAHGVPDAGLDAADLPDPFGDHILLARPQVIAAGHLVPVTANDNSIEYFLDSAPGHGWWKLANAEDEEVIRVKSTDTPWYHRGLPGLPRRLEVQKGAQTLGTITRRTGLTTIYVEVEWTGTAPCTYQVRGFGIYANDTLIGRIYALHNAYYLDLQREHFNQALLGYFITIE